MERQCKGGQRRKGDQGEKGGRGEGGRGRERSRIQRDEGGGRAATGWQCAAWRPSEKSCPMAVAPLPQHCAATEWPLRSRSSRAIHLACAHEANKGRSTSYVRDEKVHRSRRTNCATTVRSEFSLSFSLCLHYVTTVFTSITIVSRPLKAVPVDSGFLRINYFAESSTGADSVADG